MPLDLAPGVDLAATIALVAGVTEAVKRLAFPDAWQTGRAPMLLAAAFALLATVLMATTGADTFGLAGAGVLPWAAVWLTLYTGAVGTHQTVAKAGRVVTGSTNPTGPDDVAP